MKVRYVSFKEAPPPVRPPPVVEQPAPAQDIFPGAGAANLVTLNPFEVAPHATAAEIQPGPQLAGFSPPALVVKEGAVLPTIVEVGPTHAALPAFSSWPRIPGML